MDRGAWRATVYRGAESDTTERLMLSLLVSAAPLSSVLCPTSRPSEAGGGREGAVRRPQQGSSRLELLAYSGSLSPGECGDTHSTAPFLTVSQCHLWGCEGSVDISGLLRYG